VATPYRKESRSRIWLFRCIAIHLTLYLYLGKKPLEVVLCFRRNIISEKPVVNVSAYDWCQ
jgi:hypothetical protein